MARDDDPSKGYIARYSSIRSILRQVIPILLITLASSMLAGFILFSMKNALEVLPGLLVMIPGLLATRGNIFGVYGSRLATGLHLGIVEPRLHANRNLINIMLIAIINSIIISIIISIFAYVALLILAEASIPLWALMLIAFISSIISSIILLAIVTLFEFLGFRKGLDPDNIHGPVATVSGDIFGILALFIAAEYIMVIL